MRRASQFAIAAMLATLAAAPAFAATTEVLTPSFGVAPTVYDGDTDAPQSAVSFSQFIGDGNTTEIAFVSATYDDGNAGSGHSGTVTFTIVGTDGDGDTLSDPHGLGAGVYRFFGTTINPKPVTVTLAADNKEYDQTGAATGTLASVDFIGGDTVTLTSDPLTFASTGAGTGITVTASNLGLSNTDAGNYEIDTTSHPSNDVTDTADITAKQVTVTLAADSKEYDQTDAATGTLASTDFIGGDDVAATSTSITFASPNAGTGIPVTASGLGLSGGDAANYSVTTNHPTGEVTGSADIDAKQVTVTLTADNKTYDKTDAATGTLASTDFIGGDTVTLSSDPLTFASTDAGTGITVTATGLALGGAQAGNYSVTTNHPAGEVTGPADIDPRPITVTAVTASKTYDGDTSATGTPTITSGSLVGGDSATWTQAFESKNIDPARLIIPAGTVSDGNGGNNYDVTFASVAGVISARPITVTAVTDSKPYDDDNTSSGVPTITAGSLAAVDTVAAPGWTQTFDDKHAGTGKALTPTGSVDDGNFGNNYDVTFVDDTTGEITPLALTVTAVTETKVYDSELTGFNTPNLTSGALIGTDSVTWEQAYLDEHVGTGLTLRPFGTVTDGNGGGNYDVTFVDDLTGEITVRTLTATATADDKPYDGTDAATVTVSDDRVAGDELTYSYTATFDDQYVGTGKTVSVSALTLTGGSDQLNYAFSGAPTTDTADITPILGVDAGVQIFDASAAGPLYSGPTSYMIAAELTGDDLIDVVNVTTLGVQVFRNDGGTGADLALTLVYESDTVRWSHGGGVIDLNGDGNLDLVMGDVTDVWFGIGDGTGVFDFDDPSYPPINHDFRQPTLAIPFNSHANPLAPTNEIRIAISSSSDTDVYADKIGGTTDGRPHLYVMQPDGSGGWQIFQTLDSFNVDGVVPHDLDGNGYNDLFISNRSGVWNMNPVFVYSGGGSGYTADTSLVLGDFSFPFSFGPTDRVAGTQFGSPVNFSGFAVGSWHRVSVWTGGLGSLGSPTLHASMDPGVANGYATAEVWGSAFGDMNGDGFADLVAVGRNAPMTIMRLDSDPNIASNRLATALLSGTSHDVKVRDFDYDGNDAPDVIIGRSDGLWYYHNVNGASNGSGSPAPPPTPPTAGEFMNSAIDSLYAAVDPASANPIESDTPTVVGGGETTYVNEAGYLAGEALGHLLKIDARFRNETPNFVFGATDAARVETLRLYNAYIEDAEAALMAADALTSDATDEATIAGILSALASARADIVAQGQALGGVGVPFKKGNVSRRMARLKTKATQKQYDMLEAMAAARNTGDEQERNRLTGRAYKKSRQALAYLRKYYKRMDKQSRK